MTTVITVDTSFSAAPVSSFTGNPQLWGQIRIANRFNPINPNPIMAEFTPNRDVEVIVVDSGIDKSHPEFVNADIQDLYFVPGFGSTIDDTGHGTAMTSLIIGKTLGVFPQAKVKVVKVMGKAGGYETSAGDIYAALDAIIAYCRQNPTNVKVLCNAWQCPTDPVISDKVKTLIDEGVVFIGAAGNVAENIDTVAPAGIPGVVTVAGTTPIDTEMVAIYGVTKKLDIYAPGADIYVASLGGGYSYGSGSSAATALTSGIAAMIYSMPAKTPLGMDVVASMKKDATLGALTVNPRVSTGENKLLHHPSTTGIINGQDYYLGEFLLPNPESLPTDLNQAMPLDQFAYAFNDFTYEFIFNDESQQFAPYFHVEFSHLILTVPNTFTLPPDETMKVYSFQVAAIYDGSVKMTSPTFYFYVVGPTATPAEINQNIANLQKQNSLKQLILEPMKSI